MHEVGVAGRRLGVYAWEAGHSSTCKGTIVAGLGRQGLRAIAGDNAQRMRPDLLASAIDEDIASGSSAVCVVATVGTTSMTSIDPVPQIADVCERHELWLHVDGAYGGMAAIAPEHRSVLAGANRVNSIVVNPHKWLFTPIDCSALFIRDPESFRRVFSLVPEYLTTPETDVTNYMDWGFQLGRRFRALKLWMVIRTFGWDGLADRLRHHIRLGRMFAQWVDASPDFVRTVRRHSALSASAIDRPMARASKKRTG